MSISALGGTSFPPLPTMPSPIESIQNQNTYPPEQKGAMESMRELTAYQPATGVNNAGETSLFGSKGDSLEVIAERMRELVEQAANAHLTSAQDNQAALYQADGTAQSQAAGVAVGMFVDMYA